VEKKVKEYLESQYPYWVVNIKRAGAYLGFIEKFSNPNNTPEENYTMIDQEFNSFDDFIGYLN